MTLVLYADPAIRSSAGIEPYAEELIRYAFAGEWADRTVLLTSSRVQLEALLPKLGCAGAPVVETPLPARALRYAWSFTGLPAVDTLVRAKTGRKVALVHNPVNLRTPTRSCPHVVTIHDMFMFKLAASRSLRQRLFLSREIEERAVRGSRHMLTPSMSTKRDIMELFDVPDERIKVIPQGIDHGRFRPCTDPEALARTRERLGIPERYVLFVGSLYSRKLGNLLEAYQQVARQVGPEECKLVVVGGRESTAAGEVPVAERIRRLGLERFVVQTGELPDAEIPLLMSGAALFTYVSFYEGFGLTPLEAMACGAPVVATNVTSVPEVLGDAAILVDPRDVAAVAEAILRVLGDEALRADLRERSLARAALYSWGLNAQRTFAHYATLIERAG